MVGFLTSPRNVSFAQTRDGERLKAVVGEETVSIKKTLAAAVFAWFALAAAHAQDPLKTEAKHYSLAFENETVQVLMFTTAHTRSQGCTIIPAACWS